MRANQSPPTRPLEGFDNRLVNSTVLEVETSAGNRGLGSIDSEILAARTQSTPIPRVPVSFGFGITLPTKVASVPWSEPDPPSPSYHITLRV